ncbi:hypothetical protein [Deinococcus multiflagellatus]|uniref:Uncharacterized protein n=1 Tax=Deinococcus multiflagellatus TaxID=1656887 RepID=A0ABW1ZPT3_9DEIO|nr:hypothetical protein [Deinococcus multiflagellatus]MBZ9715288.1 hypothetical protein [Deinococcus multiflagellatus]
MIRALFQLLRQRLSPPLPQTPAAPLVPPAVPSGHHDDQPSAAERILKTFGEQIVVLCPRRDDALSALDAAGISPVGIVIVTSPEDLRGLRHTLVIHRVGRPFARDGEARLQAILATSGVKYRLYFGL